MKTPTEDTPVSERKSIDDEPAVEVCGQTVKHNAVKWRTAKNRHSNTDGSDWGWIEGAPGNICWSNSSKFNREAAEQMAAIHNQWLEDQKPLSIKLIEARERRAGAAGRFDSAKTSFEEASAALSKCDAELAALAVIRSNP